jgi:hypothetical protein
MSIFIHQIGEFVTHIESSSLAGLKIDLPRSFRGGMVQPDNGVQASFTHTRQLPELQDVQITGTLVCTDCLSVTDQINRLMAMGGVPFIDIIGYLPNVCCGSGECSCGGALSGRQVQWVTTTGMITKIDRATEISDNGNHPGNVMEVSLSLVLDPYWQPLNKFSWDVIYGTDSVSDWAPLSALLHWPGGFPKYPDGRVVFRRKYYEDFHLPYAPNLWTYRYYDSNEFVASEFQTRVRQYTLAPNVARWNAPLSSIYAFRNLPPSGTIYIDVLSEIAPGRHPLSRSYLVLDDLDALLADYGHTGLQSTDEVFATDGLYGPGFILRAGEPLTYLDALVIPEWNFAEESPGQLLGRNNRVTFENLPSVNVETAWLHSYRLL